MVTGRASWMTKTLMTSKSGWMGSQQTIAHSYVVVEVSRKARRRDKGVKLATYIPYERERVLL